MKCEFLVAWAGKCGKETSVMLGTGLPLCDGHLNQRCKAHDRQALRDCGTTYMFVCGAKLCADCHECRSTEGGEAYSHAN